MKPYVFIGSSAESAKIADAIQIGLSHDARSVVWHQAFPLASNTIDTLYERFSTNDFAVFIFSPDDRLEIRSKVFEAARDNVLFEAGLFMGLHGKKRVFIILAEGHPEFHIATDLLGFTTASYDPAWAKSDVNAALGTAVSLIKQAIDNTKQSQPEIDITCAPSLKEDATWPLKLNIQVSNRHSKPVAIESLNFDFNSTPQRAPNAELVNGIFRPKFLVGKDSAQADIYEKFAIVQPNRTADTWIPFDPVLGLDKLREMVAHQLCGLWTFRCTWLETPPVVFTNEQKM